MALIVFGLIVFIVGIVIGRVRNEAQRFGNPARILGLLLIAIGIFTSCIIQVDAGQVGVKKLFGKVQNDVLGSGLHFINPLLEVEKLDVKTKNYTMSGVHDEGQQAGDDAIRVLTTDGLEVTIDLSVLYRVLPNDAPKLLRETGIDYEDKIVRPITRTRIRDNAVYYEAIALYSTRRDEFQQRIFKTIENDFRSRGLLLEQLLVRNITLPQSVKSTIEQKINAEQEAQKMQFVLQKKNRRQREKEWKRKVLPIISVSSATD